MRSASRSMACCADNLEPRAYGCLMAVQRRFCVSNRPAAEKSLMIERPSMLPISKDAEAAVLALNNAHAAELSWLDPERMASLLGQAFRARRIGHADAFL